jgi:hypothetical protein
VHPQPVCAAFVQRSAAIVVRQGTTNPDHCCPAIKPVLTFDFAALGHDFFMAAVEPTRGFKARSLQDH